MIFAYAISSPSGLPCNLPQQAILTDIRTVGFGLAQLGDFVVPSLDLGRYEQQTNTHVGA